MRLLRWFSVFSLPLFSKELIEQSNRRRTFVIRTLYAALCYSFLLIMMWDDFGGWNTDSLSLLGRGRELFEKLVALQFFAIYAFLPGLACGVLTSEKERDTLAMLLLTKLGPWTIIIEKLLSRLMPLFMLLLLSLPLLAVAYSLGGVESGMILFAAIVLGTTALQVGALAVFCSAWFRTTAGAFVGTYVIGFCLFMLPGWLAVMRVPLFVELANLVGALRFGPGSSYGPRGEVLLIGFGPYVFYEINRFVPTTGALPPPGFTPFELFNPLPWMVLCLRFLWSVLGSTFGLWSSALIFLTAARVVLWRRAFIQPKQRILQFFRWLDGLFHRLNQNRVTQGIVLVHESVALPLYQPIAWRETRKKTLGTTRYLVRFLLVIEPPLLFFLLLADTGVNTLNPNQGTPGVVPNILLWLVVTIALTVLSTGLIAGEKTKQTLDVLLSTPLTTQEIIRQKLASIRKLTAVLWIPLLTVLAFDIWWRWFVVVDNVSSFAIWILFLIERLTPMIVYPALITWIGFHFGLRLRNQGQALLATLGVIAAWCFLPAMMMVIDPLYRMGQAFFGNPSWLVFCPVFFLVDPLRYEAWNDWRYNQWSFQMDSSLEFQQAFAFVLHFVLCALAWYLLRRWGYLSFAQAVKRNEGTAAEEAIPAAAPV